MKSDFYMFILWVLILNGDNEIWEHHDRTIFAMCFSLFRRPRLVRGVALNAPSWNLSFENL